MAGERKPQREEPAAAAARSPPPPGRPWLGLGRGCQSCSSCRSLEGAGARVGSGAKPRPQAARWAGSVGVGRARGCPACPQIPAGDEAQEGTDTGLRAHSETHAASHEAPSVFPSELFLPHFSPDRSKPTMGTAHPSHTGQNLKRTPKHEAGASTRHHICFQGHPLHPQRDGTRRQSGPGLAKASHGTAVSSEGFAG